MTVLRLLPAGLGVAVLVDGGLGLGRDGAAGLLVLPLSVVVAGCALLALQRSAVVPALVVAATAPAWALVLREYGVEPLGLGVAGVPVATSLGGVLLVVLLCWRSGPAAAVLGTAALVGSALGVAGLHSGLTTPTLLVGALLLAGSVTTGVGLRERGPATRWRLLARRQWPLATVLALLFAVEVVVAVDGSRSVLSLVAPLTIAVLAVLGPLDPVRLALGAAVLALLSGLLLRLTGLDGDPALSLTQLGAAMTLVAFAVRWARPWPAALAAGGLTAATGVGELLRIRDGAVGLASGGLLLTGISVGTGLYFRARDTERASSTQAQVLAVQQAERLELARELHDVVAHHVTGMVVRARAAGLVTGPGPAQEALSDVARSGSEALTAMRALVSGLRAPTGTMDLAADLRAAAERSRVPVRLDLAALATPPPAVGRSVLRIVQESLTNVAKHAEGATLATVVVGTADDQVHVRVADDGRGSPVEAPGFGLLGMGERVELLGGRFRAGPGPDGGWRVEASLPVAAG